MGETVEDLVAKLKGLEKEYDIICKAERETANLLAKTNQDLIDIGYVRDDISDAIIDLKDKICWKLMEEAT